MAVAVLLVELHLGALAGQKIRYMDRALARVGTEAMARFVERVGDDLGSLSSHAYANTPPA